MQAYFVSLTGDLLNVYIEYRAESKKAVHQYLEKTYLHKASGVWKLPWCAVYEVVPTHTGTLIIPAKCGELWEWNTL